MTDAARRALIALPLAALWPETRAGAQIEEPLADSVRSALSAAIAAAAPPRPAFDRIEERLSFLRWKGAMGDRSGMEGSSVSVTACLRVSDTERSAGRRRTCSVGTSSHAGWGPLQSSSSRTTCEK